MIKVLLVDDEVLSLEYVISDIKMPGMTPFLWSNQKNCGHVEISCVWAFPKIIHAPCTVRASSPPSA